MANVFKTIGNVVSTLSSGFGLALTEIDNGSQICKDKIKLAKDIQIKHKSLIVYAYNKANNKEKTTTKNSKKNSK
jgi:hypothetical protein